MAALMLFVGWVAQVCGAELAGRVTIAGSFLGIEGVKIEVDASPFDGTPEREETTGPFGFYAIDGLMAGNWRIQFTHPAYVPHVSDVTVGGDVKLPVALNRGPDSAIRFDVFVQVSDVKTGVMLKNVPVGLFRFQNAADPMPTDTFKLKTDNDGMVSIVGALPGFYRFRANDAADGMPRGGWEDYSTLGKVDDLRLLSQAHAANIMLKPLPQDFTVEIRGFDARKGPMGQAGQKLENIYVEMTGVHPDDHTRLVVPPRTGITDADGQVKFRELWAIPWRVRVKHAGYVPIEMVIQPNASDSLPASPFVQQAALQPTALNVVLSSVYRRGDIMTNLTVKLTGLTDTDTAGVYREMTSQVESLGLGQSTATALFTNILPGRYEIQVRGTNMSQVFRSGGFFLDKTFKATFDGAGFGEAMPALTNDAHVPLLTHPAIIRGRLLVANEVSRNSTNQLFGAEYQTGGLPVYKAQSHTNITFSESGESIYQTDIFQIPRNNAFDTTVADEAGEFSLWLTPGSYGIRIPGMDGYFGYGVRLRNMETGETVDEAWPYDVLQFGGVSFPFTGQHGLGIGFDSETEYEIDLLVRKQVFQVTGNIKGDFNHPAQIHKPFGFVYSDLANGGTVELTRPDMTTTAHPLGQDPGSFGSGGSTVQLGAIFTLHSLPPGAYTIQAMHPRHTFTANGGGSAYSFMLPSFGNPGEILDGDWLHGALPMDGPIEEGGLFSPTFTAEYQAPPAGVTAVAEIRSYDSNSMEYFTVTSDLPPHWVSPPWAPDLIVGNFGFQQFSAGTWKVYWVFDEGIFQTSIEGGAGATEHGFIINLDGPAKNAAFIPAAQQYRLTAKAVSSRDPSLVVNAVLKMDSTNTVTSPYDMSNYAGDYIPDMITHTNWVLDLFVNGWMQQKMVGPRHVDVTVFMKRGMGVAGHVFQTNGLPLTNANVVVRDIYGGKLRDEVTGMNGFFQSASALSSAQTLFVDARMPGFFPNRVKIGPDTASVDPDIVSSNFLTRLPQPEFMAAGMNRAGLFLPGVSRAGNQDDYTLANAASPLTMTWTSVVQSARLQYPRARFHTVDGFEQGTRQLDYYDDISEVWFIDARSFETNCYNSPPMVVPLPDFSDPLAAQKWLKDIRRGVFPNVFFQRVRSLEETENLGEWTASGDVRLDELPPGLVRPVFVAVSRGGATQGIEYTFVGEDPSPALRGVRLPPWMASMADIIGLISSATGNNLELGRTAPESGRFFPLPQFQSTIDKTDGGFLKYNWLVKVRWLEGGAAPGDGLLGMGIGTAGVAVHTGLEIMADGTTDRISMKAAATARSPRLDGVDYIPQGAAAERAAARNQGLKPKNPSYQVGATIKADGNIQFDPSSYPNELMVTTGFDAFLRLKYAYDLTPYAGKLPYIGPPIILLKKSNLLAINAFMVGVVGVEALNTWTTVFPRVEENHTGTSSAPPGKDHVYRRHFLGGLERVPFAQTNSSQKLNICFNTGVGLEAKLHRVAGLRGGFEVTGTTCKLGGLVKPIASAAIEVNTVGDWPPFTRLQGNLNIYLEASVRLWVARLGKRWNWPFAPFDYQYGTESSFALVPMNLTTTVEDPALAPPVVYDGSGATVLDQFFAGGTWQGVAGMTDALLFTDTDPANGNTMIRIAFRDGSGTFLSPLAVASVDGVVTATAAQLSNGDVMVVWTEIAAADMGNPYPVSVIRYSIVNSAGNSATAAADVIQLSDVAAELRWVATPSSAGLVYRHTPDGPLARRYSLHVIRWTGSSWSNPVAVVVDVEMNGFDAVGSGPSALLGGLIVYTDFSGDLFSHTWDLGMVSSATLVSTEATGLVSLAPGPDDRHHLALAMTEGRIGRFRRTPGMGWTDLGDSLTGVMPGDLKLAVLPDAIDPVHLLTFVQGVDPGVVRHAYTDENGELLKGPFNLSRNLAGNYETVSILPGLGRAATILAGITDASGTRVNRFQVSYADESVFIDEFSLLSSKEATFMIEGDNSRDYDLQASEDLDQWSTLAPVLGTNMPLFFIDSSSSNSPARFYRVKEAQK